MPYQTKATRSHRFILSASGIAIISLVLLISSPWAKANISGANHARAVAIKQLAPTNKHAMFATGDVDFDYAVNLRMHHQLAVDLSQAHIRNGKNPKLRSMAMQVVSAHNKEIAILDRWMAARTQIKTPLFKPQQLLSSK